MKIKTLTLTIFFLCFSLVNQSCMQKENKNIVKESSGRDPRIDNFFNAVGIKLKNVNANKIEEVSEELTKVSPLFVNAMPPKIEGIEASRPFMMLAKNVGDYFVSQIWKTQITSTDDVRFFDLSKDVNDSESGIRYTKNDFDLPGVFLNPYTEKDLQKNPKNYLGSIHNGYYFGLNSESQIVPKSHFYIMEYKLRDENGSRFGENVRTYYALVSIPIDTTKQYRLIMYAHGGDYGVAPSELINVLNEKLQEFVVVAPVFPGEPLCAQISAQGKGCLRFDAQNNLVPDSRGQYHNPWISKPLHSMIPITYTRSPLMEDINSFLGAHNAIARMMGVLNTANPFFNENLKNKSILLALEHPDSLINLAQNYPTGTSMIPTELAPQTVGIGSSRGGGVLMASLGRIGFLLNMIAFPTESNFQHIVDDGVYGSFEFQYPLFSSAVLIGAPSSMITGKMRLLTIMVMQNETDAISSLPMATDLAKNEFFVNYRKDNNYFSEIQVTSFKSNPSEDLMIQKDTLSQLITFVASNDITFLAPFVATALQNWNSYHSDSRAPGALSLFHGSQDLVVPMTESTIAAQAMNTVWAGLYNTTYDPFGNYLSPHQFEMVHTSLARSAIPGVGVAQYTFQPTNQFFNLPCDRAQLASIQQPNIIYNTNVGRCFGGGYSESGDGKNTVGKFYGHLDPSFFTGRLVNNILHDSLYTAMLTSNIVRARQDVTFEMDAKLNMHLDPAHDIDMDYKVFMNSPTFMRYMSAEGVPSADIVAAKRQVFEGEFNPSVGLLNEHNPLENNKVLKPHDVLFSWLDNVACDRCIHNDKKIQEHYGVFHDFSRD